MARKHTKKDYAPHIAGNAPKCEAAGCAAEGEYKAPRSRASLHDYRYLCLEHVREHNKHWDYFSGMNADEIEAFMKDAVTGHRPTWERTNNIPNPQEALYAAVNDFLNTGGRRKTKDIPHLSPKLKKAVALFELEYPYTMTTLKKRYKDLVKKFHPDRNHGDKLAEERFKSIANAYKVLDTHLQE
jgi:hypothetical protein